MKRIYVIFVGVFLVAASCGKGEKCSREYAIEHPVSVYPIQDSYAIGDTIWFEMNFSDFFDALVTNNFTGDQSNRTIQLKDFDFHRNTFHFYQKIDSTQNLNAQLTNTWSQFAHLYQVGTILHEEPSGPAYRLFYQNGVYQLKVGIVCNTSGLFVFRPSFAADYGTCIGQYNNDDITPECDTETLGSIRFPVNKQANGTYLTNYHLFEQFMNPALENDLDRIKKECFTFVVI